MKKIMTICGAVLFALLILSSCGNNSENNESQSTEVKKDKQALLPPEYLGNYHGTQPSYYLKNGYGDDMVINGQKVPVPSIDFKFLFKEEDAVSLQQKNLEDNSQYYYDGTIKIITDTKESLKLECSLSDGKSSNPTYTIEINKNDKTAICIGNKEPEFKLKIISSINKKEVSESTEENNNENINDQEMFTINDPDGYTNVREEKNSRSKILFKINKGEEFKVLSKKGDWWEIEFKDKTGFIHKSRIINI